MDKEVEKSIIYRKPINDRLISARFDSTFAKLIVIVCYAPTETSVYEEIDVFYDNLQGAIEATPVHDVLLVHGYLNAKECQENTVKELVMGKNGGGIRHNNAERLIKLCKEINLVTGGFLFHHKEIPKGLGNKQRHWPYRQQLAMEGICSGCQGF